MNDRVYTRKLEALQKHVPYLEGLIASLKDPKMQNREAQLQKMLSLYNIITDKSKKYRIETLKKCEDVLVKLQSKKSIKTDAVKMPAPKTAAKEITNAIKFQSARAKLQEISTPKSPSPVRETEEAPQPIVIPTEKVHKSKQTTDAPHYPRMSENSWKKSVYTERYNEDVPNIYSTAAASLIPKISIIQQLTLKVPDISKPPLTEADLQLLVTEEETAALENLAQKYSVTKPKTKHNQPEACEKSKLIRSSSTPAPVPASVPKMVPAPVPAPVPASRSPRVDMVIKDPNSIFGSLLSSIDNKILQENLHKKKEKPKDKKDEKSSLKTNDKNKGMLIDVQQKIFKRLAYKYNPKPKRILSSQTEDETSTDTQSTSSTDTKNSFTHPTDPRLASRQQDNAIQNMHLNVPHFEPPLFNDSPCQNSNHCTFNNNPQQLQNTYVCQGFHDGPCSNTNNSYFNNFEGNDYDLNSGPDPMISSNLQFDLANNQFQHNHMNFENSNSYNNTYSGGFQGSDNWFQSDAVTFVTGDRFVTEHQQFDNAPRAWDIRPRDPRTARDFGTYVRNNDTTTRDDTSQTYRDWKKACQARDEQRKERIKLANAALEAASKENKEAKQNKHVEIKSTEIELVETKPIEIPKKSVYDDIYSKLDAKKPKEAFISPLDSLYTASPAETIISKGYGFQNFKIPKRVKAVEEVKAAIEIKETDTAQNLKKVDKGTGKSLKRDKNLKSDSGKSSKTKRKKRRRIREASPDNEFDDVNPDQSETEQRPEENWDIQTEEIPEIEKAKPTAECKEPVDEAAASLEKGLQSLTDGALDAAKFLKIFNSGEKEKKKFEKIKRILESDDSGEEEDEKSQMESKTQATDNEENLEEELEKLKMKRKRTRWAPSKEETEANNLAVTKTIEDGDKSEDNTTEDSPELESGDEAIIDKPIRLTRSRKSRRSELDKLHDDIKENMGDKMHQSTGKRQCTISKPEKTQDSTEDANTSDVSKKKRIEHASEESDNEEAKKLEQLETEAIATRARVNNKAQKSSDEAEDVNPIEDSPKTRARTRKLRVLIEKADIRLLMMRDSSNESSTSMSPKKKRPVKNVAPDVPSVSSEESFFEKNAHASGAMEVSDADTEYTPGNKKKFGKKRKRATTTYFTRKKKAKKDSSTEYTEDDENESYVDEAEELVEPLHAKEYYYTPHEKVHCKLCSYKGQYITTHYNQQHKSSEVLISRFSPAVVTECLQESKDLNLAQLDAVDMLDEKDKRLKFNFQCRFCKLNLHSEVSEYFYDHLTSHTGEYRFRCDLCNYAGSHIKGLKLHISHTHKSECPAPRSSPANFKYVFGYMCEKCNFVQLHEDRIKTHYATHHEDEHVRIVKISMSNVYPNLESSVDTTVFTSQTDMATVDKHVEEDRLRKMREICSEVQPQRSSIAEMLKTKLESDNQEQAKLKVTTIKMEPDDDESDKILQEALDGALKEAFDSALKDEFNLSVKQEFEKPLKDEFNIPEDNVLSKPFKEELNITSHMDLSENLKLEDNKLVDETSPSNEAEELNTSLEELADIKPSIEELNKPLEVAINIPVEEAATKPKEVAIIKPLEVALNKPLEVALNKPLEVASNKPLEVASNKPLEVVLTQPAQVTSTEEALNKPSVQELSKLPATQELSRKPTPEPLLMHFPLVDNIKTEPPETMPELQPYFTEPPVDYVENTPHEKVSIFPGIISRVQGRLCVKVVEKQLEKQPELPPLTKIVTVNTDVQETYQTKTIVVHVKHMHTTFSCIVNKCVFFSEVISDFEEHCKVHDDVVCETACRFCRIKIEREGEYTKQLDVFRHLLLEHVPKYKSSEPPKLTPKPIASIASSSIVQMAANPPFSIKITSVESQGKKVEGLTSEVPNIQNSLSTNREDAPLTSSATPLLKTMAVLGKKSELVMKSMLEKSKLLHLFKCVMFTCNYTTNDLVEFESHLAEHDRPSMAYPCLYCNSTIQLGQLANHVQLFHGPCKYLCKYCFYRGVNYNYVRIHQTYMHADQCSDIIVTKDIPQHYFFTKLALENCDLLYTCGQEGCDKKFFSTENYRAHLDAELEKYGTVFCSECLFPFFSINSLIKHAGEEHSIFSFMCGYCSEGSNSIANCYTHIVSKHPHLKPFIIFRKFKNQDQKDDDIVNKKVIGEALLEHLFVFPRDFDTDGDLDMVKLDWSVESMNTPYMKQLQQTIMALQKAAHDELGEKSSEDSGNLVGRQQKPPPGVVLTCAECLMTFPEVAEFKEHIINVCFERSRPRPFTCFLCKKHFKFAATLIDHLNVHGPARFQCSLCMYRHSQQHHVRNHIRRVHKIQSIIMIPVNPLKSDINKDFFILRPALPKRTSIDQSPGASSETSEENKSETKIYFDASEIDLLPRCAIFQQELKCALCSYASKVRMNLVRHILFHSQVKEVPTSAPVNPVPCLEKNEMMFDKMTNLALSSHPIGRMGGAKIEKPNVVDEPAPAYVLHTKRYVCGAPNCNYLCLEECMLRHHLMALHADDREYKCQHCGINFSPEKTSIIVDTIFKHLHLHDSNLYRCVECKFMHNLRAEMEKHLTSHSDKNVTYITIRELDPDQREPVRDMPKCWKCSMCKSRKDSKEKIISHVQVVHNIKAEYKCALCTYNSEETDVFKSHFEEDHPGHVMEVIKVFYKDEEQLKAPEPRQTFDTTPIWSRGKIGVKHIRGILLEESAKIPKKVFTKPLAEISPKPIDAMSPVTSPTKENSIVDSLISHTKEIDPLRTPEEKIPKFPKRSLEFHYKPNDHIPKKSMNLELLQDVIEAVATGDNIRVTITPVCDNSSKKHEDDSVIIEIPDDPEVIEILPKEKSLRLNDVSSTTGGASILDKSLPLENLSANEKLDKSAQSKKIGLADVTVDEEMGLFGPYGRPLNGHYFCPLCNDVKTKMVDEFVDHLYQELEYSRYSCDECGLSAFTYAFLYNHIIREHEDGDDGNIRSLPSNPQIELWVKKVVEVQKGIIQEEFSPSSSFMEDESLLEVNYVTKFDTNEGKKHRCKHCPYTAKTNSDLNKHAKRHFVELRFACAHCDFKSIHKHEVISHSKQAHKGLTVLILQLPPGQTEFRPMIRKRSSGKLETESEAKATPKVKPYFHHKITFRQIPQSQKGIMKCNHCGIYAHFHLLKLHHSYEHANLTFAPYRYSCQECFSTFTKILDARKHLADSHFKTNVMFTSIFERNYKCSVCDFSAYANHVVLEHVKNKHADDVHKKALYKNDVGEYLECTSEEEDLVDFLSLEPSPPPAPITRPSKPTARKSTATIPEPKGFSYYGTTPEDVDSKSITTTIDVMGTQMTMSVKQLSDIFDLYPVVKVVDLKKEQL